MRYTGINIMPWSNIRKNRISYPVGIYFCGYLILQFCGFETFRGYTILRKWSEIAKIPKFNNLQQKIYCVFVEISERVVQLSRHKTEAIEDIRFNMMWTRTKTLNSYIPGSMQVLLIQSEICHIFHYLVNIILKLMAEFVTGLVEVVHFFSILTSVSVQSMRS